MNAILDLPAALPMAPAATAAPPPEAEAPCAHGDKKAEDFGTALEQATAAVDEEEPAEPPKVKEEDPQKKEKESKVEPLALFCFCPPPDIQPVTPKAPGAGEEKADPENPMAAIGGGDSGQMQLGADASTNLAELVQKKAAGAANGIGMALDPKVFEAVQETTLKDDDGIVSVTSNRLTKAPQPAPEAPKKSNGIPAAKQESVARKSDNSVEVSSGIVQKMPVRDGMRRVLPDTTRYESIQAAAADVSSKRELGFQADPSTQVAPIKTLDAAHLVESIRTEVTNLRMRGGEAMTLTLKPDGVTQLQVEVTVARNGAVHAVARCDRGDFQSLNSQWPQLQQSLAAHGIRMTDLSNNNGAGAQDQSRSGAFQNFDGQHNAPQRDTRDGRQFEDELAGTAALRPAVRQNLQPTPATPTISRRWQSWA